MFYGRLQKTKSQTYYPRRSAKASRSNNFKEVKDKIFSNKVSEMFAFDKSMFFKGFVAYCLSCF